jgi:putative Mg2+ transporter-C (MgtC) family protein
MSPEDREVLIRLCLAVVVGGLVGAEREYRDKTAGFRTIILITLGSALFTILSVNMHDTATARISANIVTGIGFLGAGAIMRDNGRVGGLTTAATIWLSAALGMGIGAGQLLIVGMSVAITMVVLLCFPVLERWIDRKRETRHYKIVLSLEEANHLRRVAEALKSCGLKIQERHLSKTSEGITSSWSVRGTPEHQEQFVAMMMQDAEIRELTY